MTFKDLVDRAKAVGAKINREDQKLTRKIDREKAKNIEKKAKAEVEENWNLDARLKDLRRQKAKLSKQEAIDKKRKEISEIESRVTAQGRFVAGLNRQADKLIKAATSQAKKAMSKKGRKKK